MLIKQNKPLLSICIPTYNGGLYIGNVLAALLPQAAEVGNSVEVLVVDDCSSDDTEQVVAGAQHYGPMRFIRNHQNVGMSKNIVNCLTIHSFGEFVWIWSQHCLLHVGALTRVVDLLSRHRKIDAFYVNFRCAFFPDDWPENAVGGYSGTFQSLANEDVQIRPVSCWEDLLDVKTSVCTQTYSHIVKKELCVNYWAGQSVGADFGNAPDTYSQTCTVAESMFGKPSFYIGDPVFTIYNGAQTWGSLKHRTRVYLQGYPDLIKRYERMGWSPEKVIEAQRWGAAKAGEVILLILRDRHTDEFKRIALFILKYWRYKGVLRAVWRAFVDSKSSRLAKGIGKTTCGLERLGQYLFFNCRPARWLRARRG